MLHHRKRINKNIISQLHSIEISHEFAMNFNHGVQLNGQWDLFEPTRFVYAFFAFNMIYSIDWVNTLEKNRLTYHNTRENQAKDQIFSLITFVSQLNPSSFETSLLKFDKNRELFSVVSKMKSDHNSSRTNFRTRHTIYDDFLLASKRFTEGNNPTIEEQFDLLLMSYTVRNNIFHGEKKAHKMKEKGHRDRLLHYGNIILATNESFFEVLRENWNYRRIENFEVQDNL